MSIESLSHHQQTAALPKDQRTAPADGGAGAKDTVATGVNAGAEEEGLSFWDLLDVINPLQHIPIVSSIYREITGDRIGEAARIAGGALFGGPIGLAAAGVDFAVKALTGKHTDEHVVAMVTGDEAAPPATADSPAVAEAADTVTKAAAQAPAPGGAGADTVAPPQAPPKVTGKWFSLDNVERHNGFMPLGAQPKGDPTPLRRPGEPPLRRESTGTVEVRPMGDDPAPSGPAEAANTPPGSGNGASDATSAPSSMPIGLLQGMPEGPAASAAAQPSPEDLRRAMDAQGLTPQSHPAFAGLTQTDGPMADAPARRASPQPRAVPAAPQSATGTTAPPAPPAATSGATSGNGVVQVPGWFDSAMQKALTAYEKTGRLGASE